MTMRGKFKEPIRKYCKCCKQLLSKGKFITSEGLICRRCQMERIVEILGKDRTLFKSE